MAEPNRIERSTLRSLGVSNSFEEPTSVGSKEWRSAKESNPHPLREARFSRPLAHHCAATLRYDGVRPRTRTRKLPALNGTTLPFAQPRVTGVREEIRTPAGHALNVLPLPIGLREREIGGPAG